MKMVLDACTQSRDEKDRRPLTFACFDRTGMHQCQSVANILFHLFSGAYDGMQLINIIDMTPASHGAAFCDKRNCDACRVSADYWEEKNLILERVRASLACSGK